MVTPKVCMGCFAEWEDDAVCPYCGYDPKNPPERIEGVWGVGDVVERRYLFGAILCTTEDMAVWRVYDNDLGIVCYFIRQLKATDEELETLARRLMSDEGQSSGGQQSDGIVVLGIRVVARRRFLVISAAEKHLTEEAFLALLQQSAAERKTPIQKVEYTFDHAYRDKILPEDTLLDGRYRVIGCIGVGGFGITYLCEDIPMRRNVAVKEYFPVEWVDREGAYVAVKHSRLLEVYRIGLQSFYKEAKMTAYFIHTRHMVTIFDIFAAHDTAYMVMAYIPGTSVGREMRGRAYKPYSPAEMADIVLPVLETLTQIHDKKIVHSDISPGNIMLTSKGEVCLIDLGAAKFNVETQPILSTAFLKKDYAAPEQYRTAKTGIPEDEGPWTDLYAVGATMYYLLTGHKPTDAVSRLGEKTPELVSPKKYKVKVSKPWMKLIHQCMELDCNKRPRSAAELAGQMRALLR